MSFSFTSHNLQFLNYHRDSKSRSDDSHGGYESDGSRRTPGAANLNGPPRRQTPLALGAFHIIAADTGAFADASGEREAGPTVGPVAVAWR